MCRGCTSNLCFDAHCLHSYNYRELDDITRTCNIYEVPHDMLVVEFAMRTRDLKDNYNIISGCGYYEFTKNEYIPPESQVILMDEVSLCT